MKTRTAAQIAASLCANAQAYHEGMLTHEEHRAQNLADWKAAGRTPRVHAEVMRILHDTYAANPNGAPIWRITSGMGGGARARVRRGGSGGGGGGASLSDAAVHDEIDRIRRAYKSAETRARNVYSAENTRIFSYFHDNDDVTRAARANALQRAAITLSESLDQAFEKRAKALRDLRLRAGAWADLVPSSNMTR